jgi:adenylate kinase
MERGRMAEGRHGRGSSTGSEATRSARIVLLMGAPGSGKGTQSALLESRLGFSCVSTGAMLREEAKKSTPAGFRLRQTMGSGGLVDDAMVCDAVASQIKAFERKSAGSGASLILDGFPRNAGQADCLDRFLAELGMPGPLVLHLDVPADILRHRLARRRQCASCGAIYNLGAGAAISGVSARRGRCAIDNGALVERDDDSEGVVARRLAEYELNTMPVLDYYRTRDNLSGNYRRIDGNRNAAEIAKEVCDIVLLFTDAAVAA